MSTEENAGIFAGLNLEKANMNQSTLPDGAYTGYISDAKIVTRKNGGRSLVLTYKVEDTFSEHNDETAPEWRNLPVLNEAGEFKDSDSQRDAFFLKQRLVSLGIDANVFDTLKLDDLIGIAVTFTVATKGEYKNIRTVKLRNTIGDTVGNLF